MFYLPNKEFTFDVDVSNLPCGLNGALYFVEMDEAGGKYPTNTAGASYGTGYCDAQCPVLCRDGRSRREISDKHRRSILRNRILRRPVPCTLSRWTKQAGNIRQTPPEHLAEQDTATPSALYFVEMDEAGGKYPTNTAGASCGTGYCD